MAISNIENAGNGEKKVQERLIDVAEALFCEQGYNNTSVRELAAAADCNLAAVNYYFGGREKLYMEVWRRLLKKMIESFCLATAPDEHEYLRNSKEALQKSISEA